MRSITSFADASVRPAADPRPLARWHDGAQTPLARVHAFARDPIHGAIFPGGRPAGRPDHRARARRSGPTSEGARRRSGASRRSGSSSCAPRRSPPCPSGDAVDVTLRVGNEREQLRRSPRRRRSGATAGASSSRCAGRMRAAAADDEPAPGEQREAARWSCGHEYLPTGVAASSVRYDDHVHFRIVDISRERDAAPHEPPEQVPHPRRAVRGDLRVPDGRERCESRSRVVNARVVRRRREEVPRARRHLRRCSIDAAASAIAQYLLRFGPGTSVRDAPRERFEPSTEPRVRLRLRPDRRRVPRGARAAPARVRARGQARPRGARRGHGGRLRRAVPDPGGASSGADRRQRAAHVPSRAGRCAQARRVPRAPGDPACTAIALVEVSKACTHPTSAAAISSTR